jgi:hypothetical protein
MVIFVWVICAALTFVIAWWKDRPWLGVALAGVFAGLALLFGVIVSFVGVFGAALVPAKANYGSTFSRRRNLATCPHCAGKIPIDARMCGHCFQRIEPAGPPMTLPPSSAAPPPPFPPPNER